MLILVTMCRHAVLIESPAHECRALLFLKGADDRLGRGSPLVRSQINFQVNFQENIDGD